MTSSSPIFDPRLCEDGFRASCSRRHFMHMMAGIAVSAMLPPVTALAESAQKRLVVGFAPDKVAVIDVATMTATNLNIGFPAHSYVPIAHEPNRVWAIEKWGRHAAEIDIRQAQVLRRIECPSGSQFYGHGLYWPKKNLLLISCVNEAKNEGQLAGYDYDSLKPVASFIATAGTLHECRLISDDMAMVGCSGLGGSGYSQERTHLDLSGLAYLDLNANKLVARKQIRDDKQSLGHFYAFKNGAVIALSTQRPQSNAIHGNLYYAPPDGDLHVLRTQTTLNQRLVGQMLSVAADEETGYAIVTNPESKTLVCVDTKQQKITGWLANDGVGMVYDKQLGFITSSTEIRRVNPTTHQSLNLGWQTTGMPLAHSLLV